MELNGIYLLLGSNLGERLDQLKDAREACAHEIGTLEKASGIYETEAWGSEEQPTYLNQVLFLKTALTPMQALEKIQEIEKSLGRIRYEKWGSRIIDIDILYYDDLIVDLPSLSIPHPYIQDRRFTLAPLVEIAPNFVHPKLHQTQQALLDTCPDLLEVHLLPASYAI